jgi:hypothetical protein
VKIIQTITPEEDFEEYCQKVLCDIALTDDMRIAVKLSFFAGYSSGLVGAAKSFSTDETFGRRTMRDCLAAVERLAEVKS